MNYKKALLTLSIALFTFTGYAQDPLQHMKDVTVSFDNLKNDTWGYMKAITRGKGEAMVEKKRQVLIDKYQEERNRLSKVKDSDLKTAAYEYIDLSIAVLKEDFDDILDMKDIAEQSYDDMEAYLMATEQAGDKLTDAFTTVQVAQTEYAKANEIELIDGGDDKLTQKIEKASRALDYYNRAYLIFFKSYKQEMYALDALNRMDVAALDQNTSALKSTSVEGKAKLKELGNFDGDAALKIAADKVLNFYSTESEDVFPIMSDFYVKQESFEKANTVINSKNQKKLTNKEIDEFNALSAEYNKAVDAYNRANDKANADREKILNAWNLAVERFFEKHAE